MERWERNVMQIVGDPEGGSASPEEPQDSAWKYISAGDIKGLNDYTDREYNYRDVPFVGQIVGHSADSATSFWGDVAKYAGADALGDYLTEKAQEGEDYLPQMTNPELSLAYLTDPNGLASAFGMLGGSMLAMAPATMLMPASGAAYAGRLAAKLPGFLGRAGASVAPGAARWAMTGPLEAASEAGDTMYQAEKQGASPEEARSMANKDFLGNAALLSVTNGLEGGLLGKSSRLFKKIPKANSRTLNALRGVANFAPATAAEMALQGYEEGAQQGIQNMALDNGATTYNQVLNPLAWNDDQWNQAKFAVAGSLPLVGGAAGMNALSRRLNRRASNDPVLDNSSMQVQEDPALNPQADTNAADQIPDITVNEPEPLNVPDIPEANANANAPKGGNTGSGLTDGFNEWAGKRMDNGKNGCVEAVGKMGSHYSSFLAEENAKGVVYVPTLVADAGDRVIAYDPSKVERGDVIVYGDNDHVVIADGNGGYYGNSSSQEKVIHGDDLNSMGGLAPTKIIKTGGDTAGGSGNDSIGADVSGKPGGNIATAISQRTGLPADWIWAQMAAESGGDMNSTAARENHNYAGIDSGNRHFDSDEDFVDYMVKQYEAYRGDGIFEAKTMDEFAERLRNGGYFTDDLSHYQSLMHDALGNGGSKGGNSNTTNVSNFAADVLNDAKSNKPYVVDFFGDWVKDIKAATTNPDILNDLDSMSNSRGIFRNTPDNREKLAQKYAQELKDYANTLYATRTNPDPERYVSVSQRPKTATVANSAQTGEPQKIEISTKNLQEAKANNTLSIDNSVQTAQNAVQAIPSMGQVQTPTQSNGTRQKANQQGNMSLDGATRALTRFAVGKVNKLETASGKSTPESIRLRQAIKQGDVTAIMIMYPQESASVLAPYMNANARQTHKGTQINAPQERNANATPLMLQQGQNLINLAQQNNVALPKPMIYALNRGSQTAIDKAMDTLNNTGVVVPQTGTVANEELTNNAVDNQKPQNSTQGASTPRAEGEDNQVLHAESAPVNEPEHMAQGEVSRNFNSGTYRHTKKNVDMPSTKLMARVASDKFKRLKALAKENGGYYSPFAKQFLFKDEAGRDTFVRAAGRDVFGEQSKQMTAQNNAHEQDKQKSESEPEVSNNFEADVYTNAKTGEKRPAAKLKAHIKARITVEQSKALKSIAKKYDGHYSIFTYGGRFVFNDEAGRDAFIVEADRDVFGEQQPATQSNTSEKVKQDEYSIDKSGEGFIYYTQNHMDIHIDPAALDTVVARYPQIKPMIDLLKEQARTDERAGRKLGQLLALSDDDQATATAGYIYNQARANYLADKKLGRTIDDAMPDKLAKASVILGNLERGNTTPRDAYSKLTEIFDEQDLVPRKIETEAEQPAKEANNGGGGQSTQKQARTITQDEKNYMDAEYKTRKAFNEARDGVADNSMSYDAAVKKVNEAYDNFAKVSPNEAERGRKWAMERLDYINRKNHPEIEAKEKADAEAAEAAKYHGFLDDKTKLSAGNAKKVLSVREDRDGVYKTRKEHTEQAAKDPNTRVEKVKYKGKTEYRLFTGRSTFYTVTKTEYDYFNYLRDHMDKAQGEQDNSIFGSIEDADRELLEEFGIKPDGEEILEAPDGIVNTAEERERLEKELREELNKISANPVFNPKLYELAAKLAFTYIKDGINTAKKLTAVLEARMGDKIAPWTPAIIETVRTWPKGVAFDSGKMRAVSKAVGARYEQGIRTREDMHDSMKELLKNRYKSFEPMIDAAYNGIEKFFNPTAEEVTANGQIQRESGSTSRGSKNVPAEEIQGDKEGRRGPNGRSGEVSGRRDEVTADDAGHTEEADTEEHSTGGDGVETARGGDAGGGTGERGHHELAPLRDDQEHPAASKSAGHNYEIKGKGREANEPAKRHADNVKAIKLLKKLEAENRMPTPAEQKVLAGYSGWGGLTNSFTDPQKNSELKKLLTKDEYARAQSSIRDAYFTPPGIVRAIWKGVSSLGFKGGKVLDPSMGTGNFYGCMPRDMMQASSLYGIELDSLSSRFAKMLYPSAHVENTGFQNAHVADNYFDLVISNVPFSQEKIGKYALHNFFFANGIDKVRPGGLMVFITSQGSLTSSGDAATMRSYVSSKADFIGGFKLPSGVFKGTGTDVATDVLVFQRRGKDNISSKYAQDMNAITEYSLRSKNGRDYGNVKTNKYFFKHPENILGMEDFGRDRYGNPVLNILPKEGQDTAKELAKAMGKLPHDIYKPINRTNTKPYQQAESDRKARANDKKRDLEYFERDGKVYQNQGEENAVQVTGRKLPRISAYLKVKEALSSLFIAQNDPDAKESALSALRKKLNKAYDTFVGKYGYINDRANELAFGDDPHAGTVMALETNVKAAGKGAKRRVLSAEKADIFYKRTVQAVKPLKHVDTAKDALLASLNNKGAVDVEYMAELTGKNQETIVKELGDKLYKDPVTETYQTDDEYLSGNVREKLEQAQEAAKADSAYQRNVDALKKVVPADLVSSEITVNMNAPWLPAEDINNFLSYLLRGGNGSLKVYRTNANGKIIVEGYGRNSKWESDGAGLKFLLENLLNNKPIQVFDRGKHNKNLGLNQKKTDAANAAAERITDEFRSWIWSDKAREKRLVSYYNAHFNGEVLRKYDGSHLTFPGMNSGIKLRAHQKNVVWRIMQKANTLIAHCVGAGKTFEMQTAGMEMRRLGIANKPLYCVPNNVVEQFARDFYKLYPNAKLLVLRTGDDIPEVFSVKGETTEDGRKVSRVLKPSEMSPEDRAKYNEKCRKRMRALTRIKTEDWDGVIISHDMFARLPVSGETTAEYIKAEIDLLERTIRDAKEKEGKEIDGNVLRNLEDSKASLENRLDEALSEDKYAVGIPFEELGIDQIFVDEADMFKNLHYSTAIGGVSGLTNSNAHRSTDMFVKTQWLTKHNGGRGVVFATGTPISNTMAEMYTMMRYLDRDGLKEDNVDIFDNWIRSYAEIGIGIERKPDGNGYRKVNKVKRFINMPELVKRFRKFTDVFTRDELEA